MEPNNVKNQVDYQQQQLSKININIKPQSASHNFTGNTQSSSYVPANKLINIIANKAPNPNLSTKSQRKKYFNDLLLKLIKDAIKSNSIKKNDKQKSVINKTIQTNNKATNAITSKPEIIVKTSPIDQFICSYIVKQYLVELEYDGGKRIVEIYCYGINEAGHTAVRIFQISGYSKSGNSVGYKTFLVNEIKNMNPLNQIFIKRPDYKLNDSDFIQIYCQVK